MPTSLRWRCKVFWIVCNGHSTNGDGTAVMGFEPVDGAQQGALARAEAPMMTVTSPVLKCVETSRSTWCAPKDLQTRSATM